MNVMISPLLKTATLVIVGSPRVRTVGERGFALVATLTLMVLLGVLAVGMLSLSAISLRTSSQQDAMTEARANARLALMIAIGELQEEMGPDMRVSAKSAIFDQIPATEAIDGVDQPHWLASYNSWGNWLNASVEDPTSTDTPKATIKIDKTYIPKRENMFRRWLLSLPEGMEKDIDAPMTPPSGWDDTNSVVLVGTGSAGSSTQETRAYLNTVTTATQTGRNAWWISPENHKARIDKATNPRTLTADKWETAQGDTAGSGVGALTGLSSLDSDPTISDRLVTVPTLVPAGVDATDMKSHFFDLTEASRGVLASVRTGHLKKDLSLLFESRKADLPDLYRFDMTSATPPVPIDVREPSIRPMSPEIANRAVLKQRHFAPWTRMRHFYRMYRQDSDALAQTWANDGIDGSPGLQWDVSKKPWAGANTNSNRTTYKWTGEDTYVKYPILTNLTYILSLKTDPATLPNYYLQVFATPVWVYWNPYNVEVRIPNRRMIMRSHLDLVRPLNAQFFLNGVLTPTSVNKLDYKADFAYVHSEDSGDVIFKPGQFRIFSPRGANFNALDSDTYSLLMMPGFDPNSYGGLRKIAEFNTTGYAEAQTPQILLQFGISDLDAHFQYGNTAGSLNLNEWWSNTGQMSSNRQFVPFAQHISWCNTSQFSTFISNPATKDSWVYTDSQPLPVAYFQWALKGFEGINANSYPSIDWEQDWRCRNWLQAPPFYHGKGLYVSEDPTIAHTQRIDSPFELRFGPLTLGGKEPADILPHIGESALMGSGDVTAVSSLELPSAPIGSLGGFGAMAIDPGWVNLDPVRNPITLNPDLKYQWITSGKGPGLGNSLYRAQTKATAYQSGITGPGIGNSFVHPMIPRTDVYQFLDNSKSMDMINNVDLSAGFSPVDTKAYCDYWDHVLLLNDALWDDYFVSSLADQTRPSEAVNVSLDKNLDNLVNSEELANSRYIYHGTGKGDAEVKTELKATDGYLKAAAHLMVDGMFNVNSTSVAAWQALFAGIRERQVVYRDASGTLKPVAVPSGKRIALSRFGVETTDKEGDNPESGVARDDGMSAWSGVRFLDDGQIRKLAEECVKQVKKRGPFLNFSEFINRRLADNALGTMGALQSAIDYDDASPEVGSINYQFKSHPDYMLSASQLGTTSFETTEAAEGSRFAGIPGYVIQSDLLRPIANTLSVRDDTFRIRAYGDSLDENGNILARAWCEAIVQRLPEYCDGSNSPEIPARLMTEDGVFSDNSALTDTNRTFGRKFQISNFRWLSGSEI